MGGGSLVKKVLEEFVFFDLAAGWSFRQSDSKDASWHPVKRIPSTVHQDLIDNGILEDPFFGFNELKAEWVASESWIYRTQFWVPPITSPARAVLAFDGLDTFAKVHLDGRAILQSENMFVSHRVDITDALKSPGQHDLEIQFDSALLKAKEIKKACPEHKWLCWNGDSSRLGVRKAQYHWGWDWGPLLTCAGIWKPIRLEVYTGRLYDMKVDVTVASDYKSAIVATTTKIEANNFRSLQVKFVLSLEGETISESSCLMSSKGDACADIHLQDPSLWMPAGYGSQRLYQVQVTLLLGDTSLHSDTRKIGVRKIELVQEPDRHGKSFYFRINGVDIFGGGSCWIPADSFLTNISPDRYQAWLDLLMRGNQTLIRVWGGGIYEHSDFYNACDSRGILVWQDFPFACGNYPCPPKILASITREAILNLRRLHHHPSLVLLAGNNEDYQIAESAELTYDYGDKNPESWLETDFPARYIYEHLLPDIVRKECPGVPYHPGSPWGDGKNTRDPSVGDIHQWNVWHGTQEKYQIFASLGGRFNSEFGMEAFPHLETVKSFTDDVQDLFPQSRAMDFHNKAAGHERRIATYLAENVRMATNLPAYIHLTQLIQAEAITYAYRGWRKQWGEDRKCGGALVWQLNDCWPTISWSMCDYYLRPKPAYYAMKRCLAPLAVGVTREHFDWSTGDGREPETLGWEVWGVSSRLEDVEVDVEVRFWCVENGEEVQEMVMKSGVRLTANGTTDIAQGVIDNINQVPHVIAVRMWHHGAIIGRDMDWPQPLKYLRFPRRNVQVQVQGEQLRLSAERPVKCLVLDVGGRDRLCLSDNALDLAPGDEQIVTVKGLGQKDAPLAWMYLGMGEQ